MPFDTHMHTLPLARFSYPRVDDEPKLRRGWAYADFAALFPSPRLLRGEGARRADEGQLRESEGLGKVRLFNALHL